MTDYQVPSASVTAGVGQRKALRAQASPYKIALMIMVDEHCKMMLPPDQLQCSYTDEQECELMIVMLQLVQGPDLPLIKLMERLGTVALPELIDSILQRLDELFESGIDVLFNLMQTIQDRLFRPPKLSSGAGDAVGHPLMNKTSVLGLFVRWLCIAFEKLSFSQVSKLYNRFEADYREARFQTKSKMAASSHDDDCSYGDASLSIINILQERSILTDVPRDNDDGITKDTKASAVKYSHRQAEFFIAEQGFLLSHNEQEALSPVELQLRITELLRTNPDLAEANFLSYMNQLRVREYSGAVDSLFHFFDRCQMSLPSSAQQSGTTAAANKNKMPDDESQLRGYRYAALNLAAMQYHFGHRREAIAALQESIRIAQQANDLACLQHALGWLQRFGLSGSNGETNAFLLNKLISTSSDLNLHYLSSLGVQSIAKHSALTSIQPSTVFELMVRSDVDNSQHSLSDLTAVSYAQKSALWNLYGRDDLCSLHCQMLLHLNAAAHETGGVFRNSEPECIALCHIARLHSEQGLYNAANVVLGSAKARFPTCYSHFWMLCEAEIKFTEALSMKRYDLAEEAISSLAAVSGLEATYCRCVLMLDCGESSQAIDLINSLLAHCNTLKTTQQPLTHLIIRILLLKALLLCSVNQAVAASEPVLEAIALTDHAHFSYMQALATVHLALIQFLIGQPSEARSLLLPALTVMSSHGSLFDRARAHFLFIRCEVALLSHQSAGSDREDKIKVLLRHANEMNQVVSWFRSIKSRLREKQAVYYQCLLYAEASDDAGRNRCAQIFKRLDIEYPTNHESIANLL